MSGPRSEPAGVAAGVFFAVVGVAFLLHELGVWELHLSYALPLLLIGVGLSMLVGWAGSATRRSR